MSSFRRTGKFARAISLGLFFALILTWSAPVSGQKAKRLRPVKVREDLYTINTVLTRFGMDLGYTRAVHSIVPGGLSGMLYSGTLGFIPNNEFQPLGQMTAKADVMTHAMLFMRFGAGLRYATDFRRSYVYVTPKIGLGLHYINVIFEGQFGLDQKSSAMSEHLKDKSVVYINLNIPFDLMFFEFGTRRGNRDKP